MKSVSFSAEALAEIRSTRAWYEERSPEAASHFVDAIDEAVKRIGEGRAASFVCHFPDTTLS
jgi:plasmid stabilization system protein ParE